MVPALLIMFRESLEAVLVAGIVLSFLQKTGQRERRATVWLGIGAGIAASALGAVLFQLLAGGFEGKSEQIFEAVTMLAGAVLMSTVIVWVARHGSSHGSSRAELEAQAAAGLARGDPGAWGLFLLVFVSILREGIESVLFLAAAGSASAPAALLGALAGIAAAVILGALLLRGSRRVGMRTFFTVTNILLVLFAAGLVARGIHELTEAGIVPPIIERLWDLNPAVRPDGSFPAFHEKGSVGSVLRGLFGYTGAPSLAEAIGWTASLAATAGLWAAALRGRSGTRWGGRAALTKGRSTRSIGKDSESRRRRCS
jgi:high-affinity iron transporter